MSERTFPTIYMIRYFHYPQLIHKQNCHLNSLNPYPPKQRNPFSCNHPRHPHSRVKLFSLSHIRLTKTENVDKWLSIHIFLFLTYIFAKNVFFSKINLCLLIKLSKLFFSTRYSLLTHRLSTEVIHISTN